MFAPSSTPYINIISHHFVYNLRSSFPSPKSSTSPISSTPLPRPSAHSLPFHPSPSLLSKRQNPSICPDLPNYFDCAILLVLFHHLRLHPLDSPLSPSPIPTLLLSYLFTASELSGRMSSKVTDCTLRSKVIDLLAE